MFQSELWALGGGNVLPEKSSKHTFLLVKLLCGRQVESSMENQQAFKRDSCVGSWRVTGWGRVKPRMGGRRGNVKQLTRSLDYSWNERRMVEKRRRVGKQNRKQWTDAKSWKQQHLWCLWCAWSEITTKGKQWIILGAGCDEASGCGVEGVSRWVGVSECEAALNWTHCSSCCVLVVSCAAAWCVLNSRKQITHFFWSFLFFSEGPPKVPIPRLSFGDPSASGVPATNTQSTLRSDPLIQTNTLVSF